ncbi:hypothetical protein [Pelagibacterium sp.]|uniref:hypothetical protein n=1 Tax=Pelagibacterium sp. TaxID=1967288 RepID=UPI003A91211F
MKRRDLLKGLPGAAFIPAAIASTPVLAREVSAQERYDYHLAEFKRAAEELDPMIAHWNLMQPDGLGEPIRIYAHRVTGRYEGDGIYESGKETALGGRIHYRVELANDIIDGKRTFMVSAGMDRRWLLENVLETTIGRRIGGLA